MITATITAGRESKSVAFPSRYEALEFMAQCDDQVEVYENNTLIAFRFRGSDEAAPQAPSRIARAAVDADNRELTCQH